MDNKQARYLHRMLDRLAEGKNLSPEEITLLRKNLPELPKQKTLEEIIEYVNEAWAGTRSNTWWGDGYGVGVYLEDWLSELHAQLKGLMDAPANTPAHPEFLETEADYENAPEGTIVARSGQIPWVKESDKQWSCISGSVVNYSMAQHKPRRVLRWGWGE